MTLPVSKLQCTNPKAAIAPHGVIGKHQGSGSNAAQEGQSKSPLNLPHHSRSKQQDTNSYFKAPKTVFESARPSLLDAVMPNLGFPSLQPLRTSSQSSLISELPLSPTSGSGSTEYPSSMAPSSSRTQYPQLTHQSRAEMLQGTSEPSTRNFHTTMNQKAPKPNQKGQKIGQFADRLGLPALPPPAALQSQASTQTPVIDPIPEFLAQINDSFEELMKGVQGFPGEVVVHAELGRILLSGIPPKFVASEDNLEGYSPNDLSGLLLSNPERAGNPSTTYFTNVLTRLPADIKYLADMKNDAAQLMWEQIPSARSVIYEISCYNNKLPGWNPFTIEIDEATFRARVKTKYQFGTINVHGTRRHWDFRIAAFGFGDDNINEQLYGEFANAIQSSLYIP